MGDLPKAPKGQKMGGGRVSSLGEVYKNENEYYSVLKRNGLSSHEKTWRALLTLKGLTLQGQPIPRDTNNSAPFTANQPPCPSGFWATIQLP